MADEPIKSLGIKTEYMSSLNINKLLEKMFLSCELVSPKSPSAEITADFFVISAYKGNKKMVENICHLSEGAKLLAIAFREAGEGLVELRKLEAAEDIAYQLSKSRNVTVCVQISNQTCMPQYQMADKAQKPHFQFSLLLLVHKYFYIKHNTHFIHKWLLCKISHCF
jgi:hypothetical protein